MKKKNIFVGIGVLLVFGFVLAGCANNGAIPKTTPQPKFLTITGVPAGQNANLGLSVYGVEGRSDVASATVWLADLGAGEHDITYSIHVGEESHTDNPIAWTGSGEYVIWIDFFETSEQSSKKTYYYGGGTGDIKQFNFTDETPSQTITFDQFEEVWW